MMGSPQITHFYHFAQLRLLWITHLFHLDEQGTDTTGPLIDLFLNPGRASKLCHQENYPQLSWNIMSFS